MGNVSVTDQIRIGCGAGFATDRIEPAVDLVQRGELDWLVLECLAERTIALGQQRRLADPAAGYDPLLQRRMRALLEPLVASGTRLVTNMGAANPVAAGRHVRAITSELGLDCGVAVVTGDDVLDRIDPAALALEDGRPLQEHGEIVSANAYLGADALLPALDTGARVVIAGRTADPSLFVAPLANAFGWQPDDHDLMARATVLGHLLECGAQVTGGYFADPVAKPVPELARLGFPLAEVGPDGDTVVTKLAGTGGRVDRATVAEQLLYEILDPAAYITPDVTADLTGVHITETAPDRVHVNGAGGDQRPGQLKVSVGYRAGFRGEAEISYAGPGAADRARLAGEVVRERLATLLPEVRTDLIGVDSLHGSTFAAASDPYECRLRVAALAGTVEAAEAVAEEVTALYTNGPAGGGGVRTSTSEVLGVASTLLPRDAVTSTVTYLEPSRARPAV